jgi:hypothetical protein
MQLGLGRGQARLPERRFRCRFHRGAEGLELRKRRARVAPRADILGMVERVLAALTAQRVITRARERAHFVRGAAAVDQQRAAEIGLTVRLDRHAFDLARVREYSRDEARGERMRAQPAPQRDRLVSVGADALVAAERAAWCTGDRGAFSSSLRELGLDDVDRAPADGDARRCIAASPERVVRFSLSRSLHREHAVGRQLEREIQPGSKQG